MVTSIIILQQEIAEVLCCIGFADLYRIQAVYFLTLADS
jgi:hypothetical protein